MKVRQVDVSMADQKSAQIFFEALLKFYDLKDVVALDMFARTGDLTVKNYIEDVADLDLWELGAEHEFALHRFHAREVKIGCSYKHMEETTNKYGLIVIDTPQGCHHDYQNRVHVEHFGVLENVDKLIDETAVLVLYCNRSPYNKNEIGTHGYDEYEEYDFDKWMEARADFFWNAGNVGKLSVSEMLDGYEGNLERVGLKVVNSLIVPCYSDVPGKDPYAFRLGLEVAKR